ncbi:MAG: hypothetical protein JM58_04220 [Peptococcaceae bacterium BICA1-8]|nr:MAG: hypothetical protein JM58_04220 [Peptococcaceae bacterium BICA1-8]
MTNARVTALIPAYNEEKNIVLTIKTLQTIGEIKQIVVIDDGSTDQTGLISKEMGIEVIRICENKGKGNALNIGASYVKEALVALVDADLKETAIEVQKLIYPVVSGSYDMAIAIFPPASKKGGVGLVKNAAFWGLKILTKQEFKAPLSGQRVMSKEVLQSLLPLASGFGVEVGMTMDALIKGYKILEVSTNMGHAETGRDWAGFLHRGVQLKDVFLTLSKKGWRIWALS